MPTEPVLIRLDVMGRLQGQEVVSVFTYRVQGLYPRELILRGAVSVFDISAVAENYFKALSDQYDFTRYRCSFLEPLRADRDTFSTTVRTPRTGFSADALPVAQSAVIDRALNLSTRRFHGRLFMPGPSTAAVTEGTLNTGSLYYADLNALQNGMKLRLALPLATDGIEYITPVLVHQRPPLTSTGTYQWRDLLETLIRGNLRVQLRRAPGHGR